MADVDSDSTAWVLWLESGGCDGCTMSVLGATSPRLEELIAGVLARRRIELVHPALSLEAGEAYIAALRRAQRGEFQPLILVVEGSLFDEQMAGDGSFSGLGEREGQPIPVEEWVSMLAPEAAAVIAIGTCATWGGIPAASGNVTGAMGLGSLLGDGFCSRSGLPIVNVPGCPPNGDTFVEVLNYVLLHLDELVPLDLDELGRPRWLYAQETPLRRARLPYQSQEPAEELLAGCPVPARGWINHLGGCAAVGGTCNGCTRPDFPDRTLGLVLPTTG
jgi:hydrogenase small subunit